jgi:hypothetical protein
MVLSNEEVTWIVAENPEGHRHLRSSMILADGTTIPFKKATVAALVRAYVG